MPRRVIFKISNQGVFYNTTDHIPWQQTNLPKEAFIFSERSAIFWELEMLSYQAANQVLRVKVSDYEAEQPHDFAQQRPKKKIQWLRFDPLAEHAFKACLTYYKSDLLNPHMQAETKVEEETMPALEWLDEEDDFSELEPVEPAKPVVKRWVKEKVRISDLELVDGGVTGFVELNLIATTASFFVPNDTIVKEFNWIKPYFAKQLKRKRVEIKGWLAFTEDDGPVIQSARSPQIDRINGELLKVLRVRRIKNILAPPPKDVDKSLFTEAEVFESVADDRLAKTTALAKGNDLLEELLALDMARNARELTYLSSTIPRQRGTLRYTLKPSFGFLFFHRGTDLQHVIWELINSHATYVWSLDQATTIEQVYALIEEEIAFIETYGRMAYRQKPKKVIFSIVIHNQASSKVKDGFPRWKNQLDNVLV